MPTPLFPGQITSVPGFAWWNEKSRVMPRARKYPTELLERGTRLVVESGRPIAHVAANLGVPTETLRKYVRQVEANEGPRGVMRDGRRFGLAPNPYVAPEVPSGTINLTDLDSRNLKTLRSYTQGYNVQAVVNEHQIVLAAEVTLGSSDFGQLEPMVAATNRELAAIGVSDTPGVAVADSGYWNEQQIDQVVNVGTQVLIPPDAGKRGTPRRGWDGDRYAFMRIVLAGELGGSQHRCHGYSDFDPLIDQAAVGDRVGRDGLLEQAVEEQAAAA